MATIVMYSKANCPYCEWAKQLLDSKQLKYEEYRVDLDQEKRAEMEQLTGRRTLPQIVINGKAIGGYDDLFAISKSGELDNLLNKS